MRIYQNILILLLLLILGMLSYLSVLPEYDWFGWSVVIVIVCLGLVFPKSGSFFRLAFILVSAFVGLRYILFRSFYTLDFPTIVGWIFGGLLYLSELYCMLLHLLGLSINIAPVKRKLPTYPQHAHSVDVFIPTYDEDVSVSYITALACKNFKSPSTTVNVFILNDGSRLDRLNNPQRNVADKNTISTYSITFWIFLFLFIIGLGRAFWIYHDYPLFREAVYLTSFWNIFNLIIVICCIGALHEQKQPEKYYSFPVFNEYIQHKNQKLKIKRLSLSTILVELKGRFKPKTGEKITCFGTDGKISGTISSVLKNTVEIKISTPISQNNIKYIYGHSERWKNIINHYLHQKRMILLPFYLIKQGLKSTYGAFKTIWLLSR